MTRLDLVISFLPAWWVLLLWFLSLAIRNDRKMRPFGTIFLTPVLIGPIVVTLGFTIKWAIRWMDTL